MNRDQDNLNSNDTQKTETGRKRRTYDCVQLCRDYYLTTYEIRECTRKIRAERCPEECESEYDDSNGMLINPGGMSCLSGFYTASDVGIGIGEALVAVEQCPVCSVKRVEVDKRKELRRRLGGIKRRIANAGRLHDGS